MPFVPSLHIYRVGGIPCYGNLLAGTAIKFGWHTMLPWRTALCRTEALMPKVISGDAVSVSNCIIQGTVGYMANNGWVINDDPLLTEEGRLTCRIPRSLLRGHALF